MSKSNFKSGFERDFHSKTKLPYETTRLPYTVRKNYIPDFQVTPTHFIECKGLFVSADRAKHLHIKQQHPHIKITFVFQNAKRRLSHASKTTYADWCDKHGFEWYDATTFPYKEFLTNAS